MAKEQKVLVQFVPKKKIDGLTDTNHQGIAAAVAAYRYAELEELFAKAQDKQEDPFFLILDELEDPHNLGSIMRTADAVGAHGLIIPQRRAVGLTGVVAKSSTGAIEHVPVVRVNNLSQTVDELKNAVSGLPALMLRSRLITGEWMPRCHLLLSSAAKARA